jgi:hypothetical protein
VWRIRYNDEICKMYKDVALSTYLHLKRLMWAGHVVRMEHCIPKTVQEAVLEEEVQSGDHETDGKMSYRGMQPTCSGIGSGRLQQEIRRSEEVGKAMARKQAEVPQKKKISFVLLINIYY